MNTPPASSTMHGLVIGLATALIGVLLVPSFAGRDHARQSLGNGLVVIGRATVVQCAR
ncbi:hypothetical protein Dvina_45885 [Dactylosporangium vinaceum]|uniref:Uncharacterized protein n=1 Tax=Dactylosporangium vinaceum TaxID=53362 RepID=A0ABV5LYS2_9ACTN|nr:hypothetical protein [Dactylosporangium vinaceum]UAB95292.1 hypothetical protein Dvina_45885 [Dactylosporangium vinaceum]